MKLRLKNNVNKSWYVLYAQNYKVKYHNKEKKKKNVFWLLKCFVVPEPARSPAHYTERYRIY